MDEKQKGLLQLLFMAVFVIAIFVFSDELERFKEYGYIGVFIVSLVSAASIFLPAPGWAIVIAMARFLDPIVLGLAAGTGSALGEITGYIAGQGASKAIHANSHFKRLRSWMQKNDLIAVFFLAAIPNPLFDVAGIAAGSLGIPLWRFLLVTAVGRIIRYALLAYLGLLSVQFI